MLVTIRRAQMDAFRQAIWTAFVDEALAGFDREPPEQLAGLDREERRRRVAAALERGRRHGLRDTRELVDFAACALRYGRGFDRHPVVRALLVQPGLAPEARWRRLRAGLPARVWAELDMLAQADTDANGPWGARGETD